MKINFVMVGLWAIVAMGAPEHSFAEEPKTMLKIVIRDGLPEHANWFSAEPRTIFLSGPEKGHIEEVEDVAQHLKQLIVINGKSSWLINLVTKSGSLHTDHSPTNNLYLPVFIDARHNDRPWSKELIIGHELDYMKSHNVQPLSQSDGSDLYSTAIADLTVKLAVKAGVPTQADVEQGDHLISRLIYDSYTELPVDLTLFTPPSDVAISDPENELKNCPIKSMNDLRTFTTDYQQSPDPSKIKDVIQFLQITGQPNSHSEAPLQGFLQMIFISNPDKVPEWKTEISKSTGFTKDFFDKVLSASPVIDSWPRLKIFTTSETDNDFCWGAYFASGDERFLKVIVERMKLLGYKTDMQKYLVGASAQWSLSSLSRQQPNIKEFLQKELAAESDPEMRKAIQDAMSLNPSILRDKMSSFRK